MANNFIHWIFSEAKIEKQMIIIQFFIRGFSVDSPLTVIIAARKQSSENIIELLVTTNQIAALNNSKCNPLLNMLEPFYMYFNVARNVYYDFLNILRKLFCVDISMLSSTIIKLL